MSSFPPMNVPTLTEVIELPQTSLAPPSEAEPMVVHDAPPELSQPSITEVELTQRVLADIQRQLDGMLDFRLREAVGPILVQHTEALVHNLREELERTMRDVVARSVAQEMAKLRQR